MTTYTWENFQQLCPHQLLENADEVWFPSLDYTAGCTGYTVLFLECGRKDKLLPLITLFGSRDAAVAVVDDICRKQERVVLNPDY